MNINQDQANYLLNPSNYNYRETLLIMDGRSEELIFSKAILYCRRSKGMLMIINIEFLILFFIFFFLGIYGLVKSTDLSASFFILLIALVAAIGINLHYRYAYFPMKN